jgi:hypothetical protein
MAIGHELIAAGLLLLAGPPDTDLLLRWVLRGGRESASMSQSTGINYGLGRSGEVLMLHNPARHLRPHPEAVNTESDDRQDPPHDVVAKETST